MASFVDIYAGWVTLFTIGFMFLPIGLCLDWYKKKSSKGFSAFGFVCISVSISLWLRYSFMINDPAQQWVNAMGLLFFCFYLTVYYIYQPEPEAFHYQALGGILSTGAIYYYVDYIVPAKAATNTMGQIAATVQILSMAGMLYEIYRVFKFKTTEYLPFGMTLGGLLLALQWWIYGALIGDSHIQSGNVLGIVVNCFILVLYLVYPPLTWSVPLAGSRLKGKSE